MRPTGVVLIALYHFLSALFLLLFAITIFVGGGILAAMFGGVLGSPAAGGVGLFLGVVGGAIFFCYALVACVAGYGMWTVRGWGRILSIVLAVIALLFALPGLLAFHFHFLFGTYRLFRLAISIAIIWYLMQPRIAALFKRTAPIVPAA